MTCQPVQLRPCIHILRALGVFVGQAGAFLKCYEMLNPWSMHVQESFDYILCSDDDIYPCDTADRLPIFSDYHASTPRPLVFTQCCLLLC